jgi:hypothetical protein
LEVKKFNDFVSCDSCYAKLDVAANFEVQMTGTAYQGGYLVPDTLKRVKASISGDLAAKVEVSLKSNTSRVTLGPVEIVPKGTRPVATFQVVLGCIPVKIDFFFELKAQIEADITINLPRPLIAMAQISGSAEMGGIYENNGATGMMNGKFTRIQNYNLNYSYTAPDFTGILADSNLTADIRLTLIPVVHLMVNDLVPVEIELRPYVGIEAQKYSNGVTAGREAPCDQTTTSDLWYAMYYGMNRVFRIARPITPAKWQATTYITGLLEGLVLDHCKTAQDAHSIGFNLGSLGALSYEVLPAGNVVPLQNVSACNAALSNCECVKDAGGGTQTGVHANPIYMVRDPSAWCPAGNYASTPSNDCVINNTNAGTDVCMNYTVVPEMNHVRSGCGVGYVIVINKTRISQTIGCITPSGPVSPSPPGSTSGSGSTPAPAPTTTTQAIVFNELADASAYTGAIKLAYEYGWAHALGLTSISGSSVSYKTGVTVTSTAARRAVTVTFEATTNSQFTGTAPTAGATAANLISGITAVVATDTTTYSGVTAPTASSMTVRPATVVVTTTTSTSTSTSASPSTSTAQLLLSTILGLFAILRMC